MSQLELLLVGVILSILGHGVVMIVRSPKEIFKQLEGKIEEIEENHASLDRMLTRHDEAMKNLASSIDRLTARIDRLEPRPPGRRGG